MSVAAVSRVKDETAAANGWPLVRLGDVCEERPGVRDPRKTPDISFRYVDISSVDNQSKKIVDARTLLGAHAPSRARNVIRANDVIVSTTRPNLNAVALVPDELDNEICSTGFCVLRPVKGKIDPLYLFKYVQSPRFVESLTELVKGALYPAVTDKQVRAQMIPLPPLDEQRRIAARLNEQMAHVARARAAAEERLRLAQQVETACVRSAFHSESAIEWPLVRLGDVCEINPRRPRIDRSDDAPTTFVPMSAVAENGKGIVAAETRPFASVRKGYTYFADGDVIFAKITPCMQNGKHAIVTNTIDGIGFGSTEFHVIRPGSQIAAEWIHYFLLQPEVLNDAEAHFFGAVGQQRVPDSFLHELTIPLPPLDEQRRIVARLNEQVAHSRRIRTIAQSELAKIDVLPAALLREAFGASRLNG